MQESESTSEIRMLVVDDEPLMRRGFRLMLDWRQYGVTTFDEAENACAAMDKAGIFRPNIVVTDIRMPDMDGLELIGKLKVLLPEARFIIISGYSDFQYAQRAITLGVEHYLVKPVSFEELMQVMESCVSRIRQDRLRKEQSRNTCLERLLDGDCGSETQDCFAKLGEYGLELVSEWYQTAVIRLNSGTENLRGLAQSLQTEMSRFGDKLKWGISLNTGELRLLVGMDSLADGELLHDILCGLVGRVNSEGGRAVCGIGPVTGREEEIGTSAAFAARVAELNGLFGKTGIFTGNSEHKSEQKKEASIPLMTKDNLRLLQNAVDTNSPREIARMLGGLRSAVDRAMDLSPDTFYAALLECMAAVQRLLLESGEELGEEDRKVLSREHLRGFKSADALFSWMEAFFCDAAQRVRRRCSSGGRQGYIVSRIKDYVTENLSEPLNLEAEAKKYHYNPSYLSRLFKKEQGISFTDYVQEQRMAQAKKLLLTTRMNVAEVFRRVGYRDYRFFLSVFKEAAGMTPNEYRERGGRGDA